MKQAKAKIKVEIDDSHEEYGSFRVSFASNENGPIELDLDMSLVKPTLFTDENLKHLTKWQIEVTVLTLGEAFSLIQLPGETMLGHRNVIVANEQLEFV